MLRQQVVATAAKYVEHCTRMASAVPTGKGETWVATREERPLEPSDWFQAPPSFESGTPAPDDAGWHLEAR